MRQPIQIMRNVRHGAPRKWTYLLWNSHLYLPSVFSILYSEAANSALACLNKLPEHVYQNIALWNNETAKKQKFKKLGILVRRTAWSRYADKIQKTLLTCNHKIIQSWNNTLNRWSPNGHLSTCWEGSTDPTKGRYKSHHANRSPRKCWKNASEPTTFQQRIQELLRGSSWRS